MRKICSSILLVLLCILLSVSCNKNSELEETSLSNFTQFESVKNKLDADAKVANRRAQLRSASDDETPLILKEVFMIPIDLSQSTLMDRYTYIIQMAT